MNTPNYISGERLQELTDHTIIYENQIWLDLARPQIKNTKCKYSFIKDKDINDDILNANILFVYIHALDLFFEHTFPQLLRPIVLVTHNSDKGITSKYLPYLNHPKIIKWYSQNVECEHDKLISIPIGLANSQWPHGNLELFKKIQNENNAKTIGIYKNFDLNTSYGNRAHVIHSTPHIPMAARKPIEDYWRDLSKSQFCLCPLGSGVDTHRMWECLYLNAIPVIVDCVNNNHYRDLPVIRIQNNEWHKVNMEFLLQEASKMPSNGLEKLNLEYWRKTFNESINAR